MKVLLMIDENRVYMWKSEQGGLLKLQKIEGELFYKLSTENYCSLWRWIIDNTGWSSKYPLDLLLSSEIKNICAKKLIKTFPQEMKACIQPLIWTDVEISHAFSEVLGEERMSQYQFDITSNAFCNKSGEIVWSLCNLNANCKLQVNCVNKKIDASNSINSKNNYERVINRGACYIVKSNNNQKQRKEALMKEQNLILENERDKKLNTFIRKKAESYVITVPTMDE